MKNAAAFSKKLTSVLKGLKKKAELHAPDADPIEVLTMALLAWESTTSKARAMYDRLCQHTVDWNDLRVCMPEEIVALSGDKSPEALERATRLKMTLRAVYRRNHEVTLEPELAARRREAKTAIEALEGIPSYAAARVLSVCFEVPIVPVDSQVRELLLSKGAVHKEASEEDISKWMTKLVKAGDVLDVHARLQGWVDTSHDVMQAARRKASQVSTRASRKRRDQSQVDRAARQVARVKAIAERRKAAEEKARQREARKVEAEARKAKALVEAERAAKEKAAKKKTTKKASKKTTKKASKKVAKRSSTTKKPPAKKVAKRSSTKKKPPAKKVAKRSSTKKKAPAKKVAKRSSTKKKAPAKKVPKRSSTKKKAPAKKVAKRASSGKSSKKTAARRKTSSRR